MEENGPGLGMLSVRQVGLGASVISIQQPATFIVHSHPKSKDVEGVEMAPCHQDTSVPFLDFDFTY